MPEILFHDVKVNVMEPLELEKQLQLLRGRMDDYAEPWKKYEFQLGKKKLVGIDFVGVISELENQLHNYSLTEAEDLVSQANEGANKILADYPEAFELSYMKAHNLHALATVLSMDAIKRREEIGDDWDKTKDKILPYFDRADDSFVEAMSRYDASGMDASGQHARLIARRLSAEREKIFFIARGRHSPDIEEHLELVPQIKETIKRYDELFNEETFFGEEEAAIYVSNLANAWKVAGSGKEHWIRGFQLNEAAGRVLGSRPELKETSAFYQQMLFKAGKT